jgi:prolyl oligopeptidase
MVNYPETRKDNSISDNYHGVVIHDPYRWLEDDNSNETIEWVKRQNAVTEAYLNNIPGRTRIRERLRQLWNYEKYSAPKKHGTKYYYFKNDGLQNQSVLYSTEDLSIEGQVFLDTNILSEDGTVSLGNIAFNKDGSYMAYTLSKGGSDWNEAYIKDIKTGQDLEDKLKWLKFSNLAWFGRGFYYSRYPVSDSGEVLSGSNKFHSLYYHQLGTEQKDDVLIFQNKNFPLRNVYGTTSEDERFLVIATSESTSGNAVRIVDLEKDKDQQITFVDSFDHDYNFIGNNQDTLLFLTNKEAPNYRLIGIKINRNEATEWEEIVPQQNDVMDSVFILGDKLFIHFLHNAHSKICIHQLSGTFIKELKLPGIGTITGITGRKREYNCYFSFTSFTNPSTIYKLSMETLTYGEYRSPVLKFKPDDFETIQCWVTSKDGTQIPAFITKKKGLTLDGNNPTLLYGYGGFNISLTPSFSLTRLPFLEEGGIYVVANIRGGGEFGKDWHHAGIKENKQNVFDDFIALAEYLILHNYTSREKLAIEGGSNGGLLVAACMIQRPKLFAVCIPRVGVLDMLRYHKFTIGWAWESDYGISDDEKAFQYLLKYSPLHNIKRVSYPATLIMTADHDDRVVPAHSFKFAAMAQSCQVGENPILLRVDVSAGHGMGKPTDKLIEEASDVIAFILHHTLTK